RLARLASQRQAALCVARRDDEDAVGGVRQPPAVGRPGGRALVARAAGQPPHAAALVGGEELYRILVADARRARREGERAVGARERGPGARRGDRAGEQDGGERVAETEGHGRHVRRGAIRVIGRRDIRPQPARPLTSPGVSDATREHVTRSRTNPGGMDVLKVLGSDVRPMRERKPPWFKVPPPGGPRYRELTELIRSENLHTVCQEAACPNVGECWERGTATFMILGDTCTRRCGFCNVKTGKPTWNDPLEPARVARSVARMGLRHA